MELSSGLQYFSIIKHGNRWAVKKCLTNWKINVLSISSFYPLLLCLSGLCPAFDLPLHGLNKQSRDLLKHTQCLNRGRLLALFHSLLLFPVFLPHILLFLWWFCFPWMGTRHRWNDSCTIHWKEIYCGTGRRHVEDIIQCLCVYVQCSFVCACVCVCVCVKTNVSS